MRPSIKTTTTKDEFEDVVQQRGIMGVVVFHRQTTADENISDVTHAFMFTDNNNNNNNDVNLIQIRVKRWQPL